MTQEKSGKAFVPIRERVVVVNGREFPEAVAVLWIRNERGEWLGAFGEVVKGFVWDRDETLVQAVERSIPKGCVATFRDDDSFVSIEGRAERW